MGIREEIKKVKAETKTAKEKLRGVYGISYYETTLNCGNCKGELEVSIPIGVSVKEWRKKNKCSLCKCDLK